MRRKNEKVLRPVHPNVGIEMEYRRRLLLAIGQMHTAVMGRVSIDYHLNQPIAQDDRVEDFVHMLRHQFGRWMARFEGMAQELAAYFAQTAAQRADGALKAILKKGGMAIEWRMTPAQEEVLHSTIAQNVALIRSIPANYLGQVEQAVLRSVQTGRDLKQLQGDIHRQFGVAKTRAALIARDQSNKATAALTRARQVELGVTEAIWMHSGGGRHPRPSHVKAGADQVRYDVRRGWFDPDEREWILPGQLINCLPGDSTIEFADCVEVAYRHWFRGHLTEVVTENGKTLRATPNHPILTPHGWVAACVLNEGDYVIEVSDDVIPPRMMEDEVDYAVPMIREVFDTLRNAAGLNVGAERGLGGYFHGDVTYSDVDVVRAARPLRIGAKRFEHFQDIQFARSNNAGLGVSALGQRFHRIFLAASSVARSFRESLTAVYPLAVHPKLAGVARVSCGTSSVDDAARNSASVDVVLPSKGKDAHPFLMFQTQSARVVHIGRSKFDGHLFNLQTRDGWYAARGIITHNCRCVSKSVIKGFQ